MKKTARMRLFFALWPCAELAASIHDLARRWLAGTEARLTRPESLHLTLEFLGSRRADELALIRACAEAVSAPAFELVLGKTGAFRRNQVAWMAPLMPDAPLFALTRTLRIALENGGIPASSRAFRPHITLARRMTGPAPDRAEFAPLRWPVEHFCLVHSETLPGGARYKELGRWPLGV